MGFHKEISRTDPMITIDNFLPAIGKEPLIRSIYAGLTSIPKRISSMFFYDATGSELFKEITRLPEYYLTRIEKALLKKASLSLGKTLKDLDIVEIGSGDCSKISILLDAIPDHHMKTIRYIPVDVSQAAVEESANILVNKFSGLSVHGIIADFIKQLHLVPHGKKRLICFLGSTLGNFTRDEIMPFFSTISGMMQWGDMFLLGVDMAKPREILEEAYNDSRNVTAEFNRNIVNVVNNLAGTNFIPEAFEHLAFYNENSSRIEMHLQAVKDMVISCNRFPESIVIKKGETIHTEISHKFTNEYISDLIKASDLEIKNIISDRNNWFSLIQLIKAG